MNRLTLMLAGAVTLSGCLDFDGLVRDACSRDASWEECRARSDAGTGGGAATTGGGMGGGGGTTGGGGGVATGGGGPTGGGTTQDGGTDAGVVPCFGNGTWCWENPMPFGAVDLYAVWGRGDDDVWFAGSGGSVLHFDGTNWKWETRLAPAPRSVEAPEAAFRAVAVDDAGTAWLVGEETDVVALHADGGVARFGVVGNRIAASSYAGTTSFMFAGSDDIQLEHIPVRGTSLDIGVVALPASNNATAMVRGPSGLFIGFDTVVNGSAVWWSTADRSFPLASMSLCDPRAATLDRSTPVMACGSGQVFDYAGDGGWVVRGYVPAGPYTQAFDALPDGGSRWWSAGYSGEVTVIEGSPDASVVIGGGASGSPVHGSYVSPTGHLWGAGSDGRAFEAQVEPTSMKRERGAPNASILVDISLNGNRATAVARDGTRWLRDPDTRRWSRLTASASDLRAVAFEPDGVGVCTLDVVGTLKCSSQTLQLNAIRADGGGPFPMGPRGGAIVFRPDGGGLAAVGNLLAERVGGTWSAIDAGHGYDYVHDIVLLPDGYALIMNQVGATPNGPDELITGAVRIVRDGFTPVECQPLNPNVMAPQPIFAAAAVDGGLLVGGTTVFGFCAYSGAFTEESVPTARLTSLWVDASGGTWLLDDSAVLLRRARGASAWTRERLPAGPSAFDGPSTGKIVGTSTDVYVIGKAAAVLHRSLP